MAIRHFATDALSAVVARLAATQKVLVPVRKPAVKQSVIFAPYEDGMTVEIPKATIPPKEAVLPQSEILLTYKTVRNPEDLNEVSLQLDDSQNATPTVVFGCRPCDARGFAVLDRPYLKGPFVDPYYKARRDQLAVVTMTCSAPSTTCFCHWVGGAPDSAEGADALLTAIEGGYVIESVTEKGEALLAQLNDVTTDGAAHAEKAQAIRKAAYDILGEAPDLSAAKDKIAARFTDDTFWEEQTAQCLSCGACTYMCPTCYCFNITDEGDGVETPGRRVRSWDTCMSSLFTREASGHNSRTATAQRMKNRISHKFSNYPETWGSFSCNGCGRCISNCPVNLDIRAIVLAAIND